MKAKSRLKQPIEAQVSPPAAEEKSSSPLPPSPASTSHQPIIRHSLSATTKNRSMPWKRYLLFLPTLLVSLPFYFSVYYLLTNVYPSEIRNNLVTNSFLLFHLTLFIANFLGFSFLFLNSRRGFLASLLIGLLFFGKLQSYRVPWYIIIGLIAGFAIIELLLTAIQKLGASRPTTPTHKPRKVRSRS